MILLKNRENKKRALEWDNFKYSQEHIKILILIEEFETFVFP